MKTLRDFEVGGKRVLVRCDFNVPVDPSTSSGQAEILNDFKIQKSLPTIKYLIENKAKVILMSHLDPKSTGVADKKYNLDKIEERLKELLKTDKFTLLENLRFNKGEVENNPEFAKELAETADIYVNDAFGVSHRAHASLVGVPKLLPNCAGFLLEEELKNLDKIMQGSEKPMVVVVGGKKVETKSKFINKISEKADTVIISGLLKKEVDEKGINFEYSNKIMGPTGDLGALDINEESIEMFSEKILSAKTIMWNGPFGKSEKKEYEKGTLAIAQAVIKGGAFSVIGGGETIEFLQRKGMIDKFSHVSTGGGAMMAYLSGEELPGLVALKN